MEADYNYGNARIRAMKSRLLGKRAYDDLLAAASVDAIIELLAQTAYRTEIEATLVKWGGARCVMEAVQANIAHTVGKIKSFYSGRPRQLVALVLARWDLFSLMTILRGQARAVPADEILSALVPAGELSEIELREMSQQPSIRATADLMLAWNLPYARTLAGALRSGGDDLFKLETRLNQLHYERALSYLIEEPSDLLVKEMLDAEIDVLNLTTLLRLCRVRDRGAILQARYGAADPTPLLIAGGTLRGGILQELKVAVNVEAMLRAINGTPYAATLSSRLEAYRQSEDVAALQRGLEELLVRKGIEIFHRDPLSVAIPIGYVWAKTNEVANLRLIAQGKALGLDRETILRDMIWWVPESF